MDMIGSIRYSSYLDYWPFAGGLAAVNAVGTQLRDLINLGLPVYNSRGHREEGDGVLYLSVS